MTTSSPSTEITTSFLPELLPILVERIKQYHKLFSLPLIGEFWEETLHRSFEELGQTTSWKPNRSHAVGEDMNLEIFQIVEYHVSLGNSLLPNS